MYTFRKVKPQDVDPFAEANGIFFQTSHWARFRSLFRSDAFLGYDENGNTVLSCLLFRLPVYGTPYSIGHISRGFVCDYTNKDLVAAFTEYLKQYCKKHHIVYTIIDPFADYKKDFEIIGNDLCSQLESLGYVRNNGITLQPRTNYRLLLDPTSDKETEIKRLSDRLAQKLRNDIQISLDRGITVERRNDPEAVRIFYNLLLETTEKKGFGHRKLAYYQKFAASLKDFVTIYLYRYDAEKDRVYTENVLHDAEMLLNRIQTEMDDPVTTPQKKNRLEPKKKEAIKQITALQKRLQITEKYKDNPYISAFFFIKMGNKAHNFFGANALALRELKLTANYWDMITDSVDGAVTTFNIGGTLKLNTENIKDDKMYDLYLYKKQYAGELIEMPGEYFLISNEKMFRLLHEKLNYFRRIVFRF